MALLARVGHMGSPVLGGGAREGWLRNKTRDPAACSRGSCKSLPPLFESTALCRTASFAAELHQEVSTFAGARAGPPTWPPC
eukprot:534830-Pyramimonas_sp.AAC.1